MIAVKDLNLIDDGRDINRLVTIGGDEVRTHRAIDGRTAVCMVVYGRLEFVEYFTVDEWDMVLDEGIERDLDRSAGTTVTTINW